MARENGWGAPRIHGELLKRGLVVDERTVSRYLPRGRTSPDKLERFGGTLRRELLDKIIVFNPTQVHRVVREFLAYYHDYRCHLGLEKDAPEPRAVAPRPSPGDRVVAQPRVWEVCSTATRGR